MSRKYPWAIRLILIGGFLVLSVLWLTIDGSGKTITVDDDDDSADHMNIQDAIDNATEGDTIRVWEGTYNGDVVVNRSINLVGNGSEQTTIDGSGSGDVVKITADRVNMSGFTVTGSGNFHSGILIVSNNNTITNNTSNSNKYSGIRLAFTGNTTITNNICNSNRNYGIYRHNPVF